MEKLLELLSHISIADVLIIVIGIGMLLIALKPIKDLVKTLNDKRAEDEDWKEHVDVAIAEIVGNQRKLKEQYAVIDSFAEAARGMLYWRLRDMMEDEVRDGYRTTAANLVVNELWDYYEELHGNHGLSSLHETYCAMPIKPSKGN